MHVTLLGLALLLQIQPDQLLTIPHILRTPVISDFAVAPDGKQVAVSMSVLGKETIWFAPGNGEAGHVIATSTGIAEREVDWSPSGDAIAFASGRRGDWHIYVSDPNGENPRRLTRHAGQDRRPRFSPDGKHIAFLAARADAETGWDLWTIPARGGEARALSEEPFDEEDPRWSPDGKRIAVTLDAGHHADRRIGIVTVETGELHRPLPESFGGDAFGARWSPDGSHLVFVSEEPGRKSIFWVPPQGGVPQLVVTSDFELTEPVYSPDGRYLAYIENRDGDMKLKLHDFEKASERTLTLRNGVHRHPVWRPDGSAVLALFEAWNYPRDIWAYLVEGGRERVSDTLPPDLDVRRMARPELVRFRSFDGREITSYFYLPEEASAESPVPLLVRPHGGPTSQWANGWHPFAQLLVQRGYAVFAPNVRGSSGFGVEFERLNDRDWGRGDLQDLIVGTRLVRDRPEIGSDRAGIWGVSYGGFLTLAAIARHPDLFACAIEAVGMPDLELLYRETNAEGRSYLEREIGPLAGNLELYRSLSPSHLVDQIQTPLLTFHGEDYPLVPYSAKQPFTNALRNRPKYPLVELMFKRSEARATYRHDLHPEAAWAYVEKILEFLEIYL